jgi:hypothetical protein
MGVTTLPFWSYCKFSVGWFFFTFVTLPVPVVPKKRTNSHLGFTHKWNWEFGYGLLPKLFPTKLKFVKNKIKFKPWVFWFWKSQTQFIANVSY